MDVLEDYVSPPSLPRPLDGSPDVTAVARANGISGLVAHKLRNYLRQKALKMDAFIAELVKASEYFGAKHVQEALMTTLGIDALESSTLVRVLVPKDINKRRNSNASSGSEPSTTRQAPTSLSSTIPLKYQVVVKKVSKPDAIKINKWYTCGFLIIGVKWDTLSSALAKKDKVKVKETTDIVDLRYLGKQWMAALFRSLTGDSLSKVQQTDKAMYDAVYDALKAKLQNAMANHQSEKKKSDFFKAIGLMPADKAQLESVTTLDTIRATSLFKKWVTDHVEVSTQPAGQERKKSNLTAATEGQADMMEMQQEPLGQKSSRQDRDEGDDGDLGGEDEGEGGEDEGGEYRGWPYEGGDYMGGEEADWGDEGGEDEGGEDGEGTGGKVLLKEYGRTKSQKESKFVPQPTGHRKVPVNREHEKGALDARGRSTCMRQPSAKARESQEAVAMVAPARIKRPRKETPPVLPEDPSAFGPVAAAPRQAAPSSSPRILRLGEPLDGHTGAPRIV
ncbi:hypothetical protein VOLCADRAFT_106735 [Volvox carteri f. nagariensis]|uniref:Uncharacterized protein n=1 Tax=Volvox carteri f. nagariensis TaxID=3068 RepID=D8U9D6_VOLCA|nr:uncharacterized protein VOLCADRAFT_106735 [Volvox carteri f. nagariensis]EFJ43622.1 hypothetical protein VOLCADRAFT_106735 [Volvox carteri f. nagariensis]|eukprot:XP_002955322.1 hypothetical protein VOLCADRAFT_106735 [Volvox carteri f. nagariensis]